jgi:hypothetical protein
MGTNIFHECAALQSIRIPSFVWYLPRSGFGTSFALLEFESPSHLDEVEFAIPSDFRGTQIQIPNSVRRVAFRTDGHMKQPIVLDFDRNSRLCHFEPKSQWHRLMHRGFFARFSERTLKKLRDSGDKEAPQTYRAVWVSQT